MDGDGVCGDVDNCVEVANADQLDANGNGLGDACEFGGDADADGLPSAADNCPEVANPTQQDLDEDGLGDACDDDDDGDGAPDATDCAPLLRGVSAPPAQPDLGLLKDEVTGSNWLVWSTGEQRHSANVYRGSRSAGQPMTNNLSCLDADNPSGRLLDDELLLPGELSFYLVSSLNHCGE
ncbi:MAG: hypothetical protein GWN46_17075, partial [Gammaproteobacteria bacterium]|nr:hypothetical protein [Gammaproteobacteria bacterium]